MKPPSLKNRLPRAFYDRPPDVVARELLGKALLRRIGRVWLGGWIVETEAYLSTDDLASHSARGKTFGNATMFGPPGTLYVYPIHAKYCMNAVTEQQGIGSAVLIRAIEPVWGIDRMRENRGVEELRRLTRGPAMLCQSLQVNREQDGTDLVNGRQVSVVETNREVPQVTCSPRIGLSRATDLALRYFIDGNWFVSGRAADHLIKPTKPH